MDINVFAFEIVTASTSRNYFCQTSFHHILQIQDTTLNWLIKILVNLWKLKLVSHLDVEPILNLLEVFLINVQKEKSGLLEGCQIKICL